MSAISFGVLICSLAFPGYTSCLKGLPAEGRQPPFPTKAKTAQSLQKHQSFIMPLSQSQLRHQCYSNTAGTARELGVDSDNLSPTTTHQQDPVETF